MKRILSAAILLQSCASLLVAVELGVVPLEGDATLYDAALVVMADKYPDTTQQNFLRRFANCEAFSFFDRVQQARGKETGDCWSADTPSRLISWITPTSLQKKEHAHAVLEQLRTSVGKKLMALDREGIGSLAIVLPAALGDCCGGWGVVMRELGIVSQLATHSFSYGTKPQKPGLKQIDFVVPSSVIPGKDPAPDQVRGDKTLAALEVGQVVGRYTNLARRWGEEPSGKLTPQAWAQQASQEAGKVGCTIKILDVAQIRALGMGGVMGVGSGAAHAPVVIIVEYAPVNPIATVAIVGKGILFDSGGLQIKSGDGMLHMKYDKCGGAAALSTCMAVAALKAPVRVVAIVPAVYNKTGCDAMHPRDVLHMMNGKTVEVNHTDAEGRLILADGLHYAEKFYNPDVLIDIATLTGACHIAVGGGFTALLSNHDRLKNDLIAAGKQSGDRVWELPLEPSYRAANDSEMADLSNRPKAAYGAGTIAAGLFLENFVTKPCWAHLDIAGSAFQAPTSWYCPTGATGAGVRLLVEYIINYRCDV